MNQGKLLTFADVGRSLGVSAKTIRKWVDANLLKPVRPDPEGRRFILEGELQRFRDGIYDEREPKEPINE